MRKMVGKQELSINLICKGISDGISNTQKHGVRTIRKVVFSNEKRGVNITVKAEKKLHPLRHWDEQMLKEEEGMLMKLEVPQVSQTKITDNFEKNNTEKKPAKKTPKKSPNKARQKTDPKK